MDRIISDEDRIRKAEDILEKRKNTNLRIGTENFVSGEINSNKRIKKMFIQVLICFCIYASFYYLKKSNNIAIQNLFRFIDNILEYDVNFYELYNSMENKINKIKNKKNNSENSFENKNEFDEKDQNSNEIKDDEKSENELVNINKENQNISNFDNINTNDKIGIGGEFDKEANSKDENKIYEDDITYIKDNFNFIKPLKNYVITSKYGTRAGNDIISTNHKGIDLGAYEGDTIFASIDGEVIESENYGDFGLHLKIKNNDLVIIYAHCSVLLVKNGDKVQQGMEIAKVGATGKATGNHLHFEIRRDNRAIDPELLVQF